MSNTRRQVRHVLLITLVLNLVVAFGKIILGIVTGALAITADGFHSIVDASGNVAGLVANTIAGRPPDAEHPYGHRRFETLAALFIGGLLLLTAWEVVQGIFERIQNDVHPNITPLTFAVLIVTLVINIFVSRYQMRKGHHLQSEILLADAQHTSSDVLVTLSVIASTALVAAGLVWVDVLAALFVVGLIARAAWGIVRQTGSVLVDTAPYSQEDLVALVEPLPCVQKVLRARSRGTADAAHLDIDVQVARETTAEHAETITATIRKTLHQHLDGIAEVEVHFAPTDNSKRNYALAARACADALGLSTHEVRMIDGPKGRTLDLHVEVPPGQTLDAAHEQVSQLEHDIQLQLPDIQDVITHIEPALGRKGERVGDVPQSEQAGMQALALLQEQFPAVDWHDLSVYDGDGFSLTMHAALPADMAIESAHELAEDAEALLRTEFPHLNRVTIHTEPYENAS